VPIVPETPAEPLRLASKLRAMVPSATDEVAARAREMAAAGRLVADLSIGQSWLDSPRQALTAATEAMESGLTRYTAVPAIPELVGAIVEKFRSENQLDCDADQITVGCGAKHVISLAFAATLDHGDEVVIPAPHWVSYPDLVRAAGGTPRVVRTTIEQGFKVLPNALAEAISPATKWVVLNSPSNPTGAVYTRAELESLAEVLRRSPHVRVLSDELYEHLCFEDFTSFSVAAPALADRTLTVTGMSKAYAMSGWRVGFALGDAALVAAMNLLLSQTVTHASSISQAAATAALLGDQGFVRDHRAELRRRRDCATEVFASVPGFRFPIPDGAMFMFVDVAEILGTSGPTGRIERDVDLASYLLDEAGVAVIAGRAFGAPGHLRISFGVEEATLIAASDAVSSAIELLS